MTEPEKLTAKQLSSVAMYALRGLTRLLTAVPLQLSEDDEAPESVVTVVIHPGSCTEGAQLEPTISQVAAAIRGKRWTTIMPLPLPVTGGVRATSDKAGLSVRAVQTFEPGVSDAPGAYVVLLSVGGA